MLMLEEMEALISLQDTNATLFNYDCLQETHKAEPAKTLSQKAHGAHSILSAYTRLTAAGRRRGFFHSSFSKVNKAL